MFIAWCPVSDRGEPMSYINDLRPPKIRGLAPFVGLQSPDRRPPVELIRRERSGSVDRFPDLRFGKICLEAFGVADTWKADMPRETDAVVLQAPEATVHSVVGLVETRFGEVVSDTLTHTDPDRDGYRTIPGGQIGLATRNAKLNGQWIHCLLGNDENYFHFLLMNIGRLGLLSREDLCRSSGLLVPEPRTRFQKSIIERVIDFLNHERAGIAPLRVHYLGVGKSATVDRLIIPWNAADAWGAHKLSISFLKRCFGNPSTRAPHRRTYIARLKAPARSMRNEADLVSALRDMGFEIVHLEDLPFSDQVTLFQESSVIVAPHGAGLSNLVFSPEEARVLEIMPDALLNWCYRSIAASSGLTYDTVLSRSLMSGYQSATWAPTLASLPHVLGAVNEML